MANPPDQFSREQFVQCVDHVIQSRMTKKVLGDVQSEWQHPLDDSTHALREFEENVRSAVAVSGWAPFHHSRKESCVDGEQTIHEPWRFYHLDRSQCVTLLRKIDDVVPADVRRGKIPSLLSGAGALVQVTWIPESVDDSNDDEGKVELRNQEHLAAASCAVQNLLLAAEARGLETYWSSGGLLRSARIFDLLGISVNERLIASVFLAPPVSEYNNAIETKLGALRTSRADFERWCRKVVLTD